MKKDSKTKIAGKYAHALYEAAEKLKATLKVKEDCSKLSELIFATPGFIKNFSNPLWDEASKKEALNAVAKKIKISKETLNCLDIIVANNRFKELDLILERYVEIYNQKNGFISVDAISAVKLSPAQEKSLKASLEKMLKSKIILNSRVNPEILGGLVIKYGSTMIDDSIEGKLNKIQFIMKGGQ